MIDLRKEGAKMLDRPFPGRIIAFSKRIVLPGFDGMPLYDVMKFFIRGVWEGTLSSRAAAISFSFFMAIFPMLVFFFTIIPMIPIANFQNALLGLIRELIPSATFLTVEETIRDVVTQPHTGWFSISFLLTFYFSTNGIHSIMEAFNQTYHSLETRSWIRVRLVSLLLLVIFSVMLILSIGLISFGTRALFQILPATFLSSRFFVILLVIVQWLVTVSFLFFGISMLFYLAPARRRHFRFISAGATLATILVILTTLGFNIYVNNFSRYNILYGSIGTLLVVLLWIYVNSISILLGFELNASIFQARKEKRKVSPTAVS
jgi:membrane protein